MSNKSLGNHFETELCDLLAKAGFWAHNMAQNETGQPADIIAVKDGYAVLIDCKVCSSDKFPLSRIEPNQEAAMTLWEERGNEFAYFALKTPDGKIHMAEFDVLQKYRLFDKSVASPQVFPLFDKWVEEFDGGYRDVIDADDHKQ